RLEKPRVPPALFQRKFPAVMFIVPMLDEVARNMVPPDMLRVPVVKRPELAGQLTVPPLRLKTLEMLAPPAVPLKRPSVMVKVLARNPPPVILIWPPLRLVRVPQVMLLLLTMPPVVPEPLTVRVPMKVPRVLELTILLV